MFWCRIEMGILVVFLLLGSVTARLTDSNQVPRKEPHCAQPKCATEFKMEHLFEVRELKFTDPTNSSSVITMSFPVANKTFLQAIQSANEQLYTGIALIFLSIGLLSLSFILMYMWLLNRRKKTEHIQIIEEQQMANHGPFPRRIDHQKFVDTPPPYYNDSLNHAFIQPIENASAVIGRDAMLNCFIDNAQGFKIAWIRVDTQTILTMNENVISRNHRFYIDHNKLDRQWSLSIREVKPSDQGWYMCQINTDPMMSTTGYLEVLEPPQLIESGISPDLEVREGDRAILRCQAEGNPAPNITWMREDKRRISGGQRREYFPTDHTHCLSIW
eukprot:TCALIF_05181-PB protein Name:"Similar to LAC Lachesin (Schistocerca americana)" AED:0.33 eAED:0.33 QI:38/0.4/0.16/1/0.6/0.33/6/0/329